MHTLGIDSQHRRIGAGLHGYNAAGTAAIGAVVHLLATAMEEGLDLSSMSGILADTAYRLLLA